MIDVSVIINTRNEEKNIGACILSVLASDYPQDKIEIIVVDCSDQTIANLLSPTEFEALRYLDTSQVHHTHTGSAYQKNFGASKSQGKYLLFLDGDMTIHKDLIKRAFMMCNRWEIKFGYLHETVVGKGIWIKCRDFERQFYDMTCLNAPRFIDRDFYHRIGGYDEKVFSTEDWDLERQIKKGRAGIGEGYFGNDVPMYHNEGHIKLRQFLSRKKEYASQMGYYINKWGKDDPIIRKQLGFKYRYWTVFVENGKWKRLIRHPILTAQMYFIKILTGIIYLINREK